MSAREKRPARYVATLERRQAHLGALIESDRANAYDRAEHVALTWAIATLYELVPGLTRPTPPDERTPPQ